MLFSGPLMAQTPAWKVLGIFDGENAVLERNCEYNINQLEEIDATSAKIVAVFDRTYGQSRDAAVRVYDIQKDIDRSKIISHSISIGERDMGPSDLLEEVFAKYLGEMNILILKGHGYGIVSPGVYTIGYNRPQDPFVLSAVLKKTNTGANCGHDF